MCGFVVSLTNKPGDISREREAIAAACERMAPRGPDAQGIWQGEGVTLGHRRLAILDLDARANQPMSSICGRYVIVFNGEIYNFRELRAQREAAGDTFRTSSDTEVLLALFAAEGEAMLPKLRGMFALAIWDAVARRGFAARDPYGIKPMYYARTGKGWLLASQVKAILATGLVSRDPDPAAQAGFWLTGSVPEPRTWYRDIRALPAGHSMWIAEGAPEDPKCWWDIRDDWRQASGDALPDQAVQEQGCEALLDSVRAHLVSDVPVGVFLSGGIDSGALAGLMRDAGAASLQGVTIAFQEFAGKDEDEAPVAASIARHYDITHHVRMVTRVEFERDLPTILDAMDQPSINGINTWFASKAVAELGLKVVVSGVGGDELFHGYSSFRQLPRMVAAWRHVAVLPGAMAAAQWACNLQARRTGNARWSYMPEWARRLPTAWLLRRGLFAPSELPALMGHELAVTALREFDLVAWIVGLSEPLPHDPRNALALVESVTYLRNQLLRDSDWASMAHSVELRTPLVDAWLLRQLRPVAGAFRGFPDKRLLAQAPASPLPESVINRPKTGFSLPMAQWLAKVTDQRAWADLPLLAAPGTPWARRWAKTVIEGVMG